MFRAKRSRELYDHWRKGRVRRLGFRSRHRIPQFSLRSLLLSTMALAGLCAFLATGSPATKNLAGITFLIVGSLVGAVDYGTARGIGPLRGRAFGGAIGGALAAFLFVLALALIRLLGYLHPISSFWTAFGWEAFCWASWGALVGGVIGCLLASLDYCRPTTDESPKGHPIPTRVLIAQGERVPAQRCATFRGWLHEGRDNAPGWVASLLLHILVLNSVGALALQFGAYRTESHGRAGPQAIQAETDCGEQWRVGTGEQAVINLAPTTPHESRKPPAEPEGSLSNRTVGRDEPVDFPREARRGGTADPSGNAPGGPPGELSRSASTPEWPTASLLPNEPNAHDSAALGLRSCNAPLCVGWNGRWVAQTYSLDDATWETWKSPPAPLPRKTGLATVGPRGVAVLDPDQQYGGWLFDWRSRQWSKIPPSPIAGPAGIQDSIPLAFVDHRLVVWGTSRGPVHGAVFNTITGKWSSLPDAPVSMRYRALCAVIGKSLVIWGGYSGFLEGRKSVRNAERVGSGGPVDDGAVLHLDRTSCERMPRAPVRFVHGMARATWRGRLLIVGGKGNRGGAAYDPGQNSWATIPEAPFEIGEFPACAATGDRLFLWSGKAMGRGGLVFDFGTQEWATVPDAPIPARNLASAFATGDKVAVWGGWTTFYEARRDGAVYNLATDSWQEISHLPHGTPDPLHPGW